MTPRELQLLISLIEDEYEEQNYPSIAYTISQITATARENPVSDEVLFKLLKRKHGTADGSISYVVSKRLYNHLEQTDTTVNETLEKAAEMFSCQKRDLSDDELCRYITNNM